MHYQYRVVFPYLHWLLSIFLTQCIFTDEFRFSFTKFVFHALFMSMYFDKSSFLYYIFILYFSLLYLQSISFNKSFLPCRGYSGWGIVVTYVRTSVRPYVRKYFWFQMIFLVFWHHHVSISWRFLNFKFFEKNDFWGRPRPFLTIFSNIQGVTRGAL